jgi:hypothetical protein
MDDAASRLLFRGGNDWNLAGCCSLLSLWISWILVGDLYTTLWTGAARSKGIPAFFRRAKSLNLN